MHPFILKASIETPVFGSSLAFTNMAFELSSVCDEDGKSL